MILILVLAVGFGSVATGISSVDLVPADDLWAAKVSINSKEALLLIDTGSPASHIFEGSVTKLTGQSKDRHSVKVSFELGENRIQEARFVTMPGTSRDKVTKLDGIIGLDILKKFALLFDFYNRKLELSNSTHFESLLSRYTVRRNEIFPGSNDTVHKFTMRDSSFPVITGDEGKRFILDTGCGGLFCARAPGQLTKSIGLMEANLFSRITKREVWLGLDIKLLGYDLGSIFEPEADELPDGISGALPVNDLLSPLILFDFTGRRLFVPDPDQLRKRLVRISKWISYSLTVKDGKLIIGPIFKGPENKEDQPLVGLEVVTLGDSTGKGILEWVARSDQDTLVKIADLIERRRRDMAMLLRSGERIIRVRLVGTETPRNE